MLGPDDMEPIEIQTTSPGFGTKHIWAGLAAFRLAVCKTVTVTQVYHPPVAVARMIFLPYTHG